MNGNERLEEKLDYCCVIAHRNVQKLLKELCAIKLKNPT